MRSGWSVFSLDVSAIETCVSISRWRCYSRTFAGVGKVVITSRRGRVGRQWRRWHLLVGFALPRRDRRRARHIRCTFLRLGL